MALFSGGPISHSEPRNQAIQANQAQFFIQLRNGSQAHSHFSRWERNVRTRFLRGFFSIRNNRFRAKYVASKFGARAFRENGFWNRRKKCKIQALILDGEWGNDAFFFIECSLFFGPDDSYCCIYPPSLCEGNFLIKLTFLRCGQW